VELTHENLLANMRQMLAVTDIQDTDRMFNCLPLFHSFGLTVGLCCRWFAGCLSSFIPRRCIIACSCGVL